MAFPLMPLAPVTKAVFFGVGTIVCDVVQKAKV